MNREPLEPVSEDDLAAYARDGAVALRRVFDADWIELLHRGVARNLAEPGPYLRRYSAEDEPGLFVGDYCNWQRIDEYRRFAFDSPAPGLGARLMGSAKVNLFHEHVLVKEAATENRTPWHHDQPYWTVDGEQVCSIWVPLDPVPRATCVEFVAGSHRWGTWYTPKSFYDLSDRDGEEFETVPDIDAHRDDYEILGWDLEPGDCIAFHSLVVHGAPGNDSRVNRRRALSLRLTGDDARFARRDGYMSPPFPEVALGPGDPMDCETFPRVWPRD